MSGQQTMPMPPPPQKSTEVGWGPAAAEALNLCTNRSIYVWNPKIMRNKIMSLGRISGDRGVECWSTESRGT